MAVTGMRLMIRNGSDLPVPALLGSLDDSDQQVRMLAMAALSVMTEQNGTESSHVFDRVLALLKDPNAAVRRATISQLPSFRDQRERAMTIFAEEIKSEDEALRLAYWKPLPEWRIARIGPWKPRSTR